VKGIYDVKKRGGENLNLFFNRNNILEYVESFQCIQRKGGQAIEKINQIETSSTIYIDKGGLMGPLNKKEVLMSDLEVYNENLPMIADDTLIQIAKQAEARIDAVIKIKQIALKVTNAGDWCDQAGKPYLQVSGAEKVANLFNVSWAFLTPEPICEEEPDGHYTFTYRARFELGSRFIEVEGSRSSKDGFFTQNEWKDGKKTAKDVGDRDNKRDVKMAALTNLLGNGITRILGIRNLTYEDLKQFANLTKDQIGKVEYKKDGEKKEYSQPQSKSGQKATQAETDNRTDEEKIADKKTRIQNMLDDLFTDEAIQADFIKTMTSFEGKDGKKFNGYDSLDKIKYKAESAVRSWSILESKIKEYYEAQKGDNA
jgi:hypothetical protein